MGPLYCGENGVIYGANDITAFEYNGSIFLVWGTLGPNQPAGPAIVEMDNPWTVSKERAATLALGTTLTIIISRRKRG